VSALGSVRVERNDVRLNESIARFRFFRPPVEPEPPRTVPTPVGTVCLCALQARRSRSASSGERCSRMQGFSSVELTAFAAT